MSTIKKIAISAAIILSTGFAVATAFAANAPGGAYIQCDGSASSPVRCTPDSW